MRMVEYDGRKGKELLPVMKLKPDCLQGERLYKTICP